MNDETLREQYGQHLDADERLKSEGGKIKIADYINPVNRKDQREEFLAGRIQQPSFEYARPQYDTAETDQRLQEVEMPDDELGQILSGVRRRLVLENKVIANLGNEDVVREVSVELFGKPDQALVDQANTILTTEMTDSDIEDPHITADELMAAFRVKLDEVGLDHWRVEASEKALVVSTLNGVIRVPNRAYVKSSIERLQNHEIGVHALRKENGRQQLFKAFSLGLMRHLSTDEGLAVYAGIRTNTVRAQDMRSYAGRVIAIASVYDGLTFRQTFDRLMAYKCFTENQAYELTLRAHRAGGYLRDYIYLGGLNRVQDYISHGGDLETLYVGKIGVEHAEIVRALKEKGIVKPPKHLPWFMSQLAS